ncbi:MAG: hypothetical protein EHM23_22825 [Acidobacteria bacterium]|nr:MAG: hypothetical protein EHM23_22825 [Acidobacteriota bacterium]
MNRKEFMERTLLGTVFGSVMTEPVAPAPVSRPQEARARHDGPPWRQGRRHVTDWTSELEAQPEEVFPLLCPVREYEWLEGWKCEMIYSESGVAEANCIFETKFRGESATWAVSRYEPPKRIEFVVVTPQIQVCRLDISLEPSEKGTRLRWVRIFTGLSDRGNETIDSWKTSSDQALSEKIEYFVKNQKKRVSGATR